MHGKSTNEKVLIIIPYKTSYIYHEQFNKLPVKQKLSSKQLPRFYTLDSVSGDQAYHTITDLTVGDGEQVDHLGFMATNSRIVVAATRAEHFSWFVGNVISSKLHSKSVKPAIVDMQGYLAAPKHLIEVPAAKKQVLLLLGSILLVLSREVTTVIMSLLATEHELSTLPTQISQQCSKHGRQSMTKR
jgi:hypothetical protein